MKEISDMEKVIYDDYAFEIDKERTKYLYSNKPKVFESLSEYLPELTNLMVKLSIDIEKPVKYNPGDASDLLYNAFGTFSSKTGYELDFYGENKFVSLAIWSHENIISIEAFGMEYKPKVINGI